MVFLEAMGHRLPIVATHIAPINEIVLDGLTGYTVPAGDTAALLEPLCQLLSDGDLRWWLGEAGHTRLMDEFSVDKMVRQTVEFYEHILR